jgi:hypothetical protein
VIALLFLAFGLFLLVNLNPMGAISKVPLPLPPLAGPDDPLNQFPDEPFAGQSGTTASEPGAGEQGASGEGGDQQSIAALAEALRDLSVTRPAAEALDQGDTGGAAQSLREVADQADQLSQDTRNELSGALQEAAEEIGPQNPDLSTELRDNASQLQQEPQQAAQALDDLASSVEQLGSGDQQTTQEQVAQQDQQQEQQGQQWGEQPQGIAGMAGNDSPPSQQRERPTPSERLNVEGVPLELESGDQANTPAEGSEQQMPEVEAGSGRFERSGESATDDTRIQTGDDPLRIPADLRDVVQEYFSPPR